MFIDTLEARQMFAATPVNLVVAKQPVAAKALVVNLNQTNQTTQAAKPVAIKATAVSSTQAKNIVKAVLELQVQLLNNVLTGKLKNLKQNLSDLQSKVKAAGSHLQGLFGYNVSVNVSMPQGQLNAMRGVGKAKDHLGGLLGGNQMAGSRTSQSSDGVETTLKVAAGTATAAKVGGEMGALTMGAIFGGGGAGTVAVATAAGGVAAAGAAGYAAGTGLNAVVTAVQGQSIGDAWADVAGQAYYDATGGDIIQAVTDWIGSLLGSNKDTGKKTPLPTDVANTSSGIITLSEWKGILAKLGSKGTPTGEGSSGGGPINTGANGTGAVGSKAIYTQDGKTVNFTVTARDFASLVVRLTSRVNPVNR